MDCNYSFNLSYFNLNQFSFDFNVFKKQIFALKKGCFRDGLQVRLERFV